ncbi:hypothetical protein ACFWPX_02710 [Nocardia sp. NPDC058518]|uniref:hypothetical protein n=1 Tax=Nocardia sp. NPDC058518 TaxID=3346534 RepID=UPI003663110A
MRVRLRELLDGSGATVVVDGVNMQLGGRQLLTVLADGRVLLALPEDAFDAVVALMITGRLLVDALTERARRRPMLGRPAELRSHHSTTDVVPVKQVDGPLWHSTAVAASPRLSDLLDATALALVSPASEPHALAELILLPQ